MTKMVSSTIVILCGHIQVTVVSYMEEIVYFSSWLEMLADFFVDISTAYLISYDFSTIQNAFAATVVECE